MKLCPILLLIFGASCELPQMLWVKSTCKTNTVNLCCQTLLHLSGFFVVGRHFRCSCFVFSDVSFPLEGTLHGRHCLSKEMGLCSWAELQFTSFFVFEMYQLFGPEQQSLLSQSEYTFKWTCTPYISRMKYRFNEKLVLSLNSRPPKLKLPESFMIHSWTQKHFGLGDFWLSRSRWENSLYNPTVCQVWNEMA